MSSAISGGRDWGLIGILTVASLGAAVVLIGVFGAYFVDYDGERRAETCDSNYVSFLEKESYGFQATDSHLWDDFRQDCASEVADLTAYLNAREMARAAGNDCVRIEDEIEARLLEMLETYSECDGVPLAQGYGETGTSVAEVPDAPDQPAAAEPVHTQAMEWPGGSAIGWSEVGAHVGTSQRVCGPLVSIRGDEHGTYLNLGFDYPNERRFTVVLWDVGWVDPIASGTTVCTSGDLVGHEGATQIHTVPEALEIWD